MVRRHPLTCVRCKFAKTTIFVPIKPSTKLGELKAQLFEAIKATAADDISDLPSSEDEMALWRRLDDENADGQEEQWERLKDDKSGADKWGIEQAAEIGVSFRGGDGTFSMPEIERPVDEDEEDLPA
ncbi:hypothetical protein OIV83_006013 [Microbotryomycetes sp. JL201]|nr:hypothetical protein OIV83_006013 [Microbotryomycetes sp. JL201]